MAYDRGCFKCVKITLIVFYVLGLIAVICGIALVAVGLKAAASETSELTPEQKESLGKL